MGGPARGCLAAQVRVRALEAEQAIAKLEARAGIALTASLGLGALNAALLLLLVPAGPTAALLPSPAARARAGRWALALAGGFVAWHLPVQLLRLRRVKVGAFEPGQLKI